MNAFSYAEKSRPVLFAVLLITVLTLSSCMHTEEHITINSDGSGAVEAHLKIHSGTVQLIDAMLGGMMQAFQAMAQQMGQANAPAPVSVAEQMFADRQVIEKKIADAGVAASLESFSSEKKDDGIHVNYKIKTPDIIAFSRTDVLMTKIKIMRNAAGEWFCRPVADKKAQKKGQEEQAKFEDFKKTPSFQSMPPAMQSALSTSVLDFRAESQITFPDALTNASGIFLKKDNKTAVVTVTSDMITNPQILEKWDKMKDGSVARTGTGPVPPDLFISLVEEGGADAKEAVAKKEPVNAVPATAPLLVGKDRVGSLVKVFLKDGKVAEGNLLELGEGFIKVDFQGIPITYYNDEINKVE
jgi:hypothetical protein